MNKAAHMLGGVVTLGIVLKYNDFNLINEIKIIKGALLSIGVLTGAFLPDLDAEHRGIFLHSIWTIIGLLIIRIIASFLWTNAIIPTILTGLIFGVLSHHFLDMMTTKGLRYFYPLKIHIF